MSISLFRLRQLRKRVNFSFVSGRVSKPLVVFGIFCNFTSFGLCSGAHRLTHELRPRACVHTGLWHTSVGQTMSVYHFGKIRTRDTQAGHTGVLQTVCVYCLVLHGLSTRPCKHTVLQLQVQWSHRMDTEAWGQAVCHTRASTWVCARPCAMYICM